MCSRCAALRFALPLVAYFASPLPTAPVLAALLPLCVLSLLLPFHAVPSVFLATLPYSHPSTLPSPFPPQVASPLLPSPHPVRSLLLPFPFHLPVRLPLLSFLVFFPFSFPPCRFPFTSLHFLSFSYPPRRYHSFSFPFAFHIIFLPFLFLSLPPYFFSLSSSSFLCIAFPSFSFLSVPFPFILFLSHPFSSYPTLLFLPFSFLSLSPTSERRGREESRASGRSQSLMST